MYYISRQIMLYCRKLGKSRNRTIMSRPGVDYETVKQTAVKLLSQGIAPSVQKIREELGTGSNSTIADHLKVWRDDYAKKTIHHLPANMPKELISTFEILWQTAMEHAQNQLAEYKKAVESECEAALQKEEEAVKLVTNIQLKYDELSYKLEQEVANKQKTAVELAIVNDRLIKQSEAFRGGSLSPSKVYRQNTYKLDPPSIQRVCPVMNPASSETKNSTPAAISSGFPNLFIGIAERVSFSAFDPTGLALRNNSVSVGPGATAFTVMPCSANSSAQVFVNPIKAHFAAA